MGTPRNMIPTKISPKVLFASFCVSVKNSELAPANTRPKYSVYKLKKSKTLSKPKKQPIRTKNVVANVAIKSRYDLI